MASDTIYKSGEESSVDCFNLASRTIYDVRGIESFTFHVFSPGVAWPSGPTPVLTVRYGNTKKDFRDVGTTVTFSSEDISDSLNVTPFAYVCLEVTTISSASFIPTVVGYGQ